METLSLYRICHNFETHAMASQDFKPASKNQPLNRYFLPGTGRFAFGEAVAAERPLFKLHKNLSDVSVPVDRCKRSGDILESKFSSLGINSSNEIAPKQKNYTQNNDSSAMDVQSASSSITGRQSNKRPHPNAGKPTSAPQRPSHTPSKTVPSLGPVSNPYISKPSNQAVAGQSGKLAAMARLAALGEDWPEEEELPGLRMPISSSLATGNISVMKETQIAGHRQKKVQTAKKKY
jgi:hypothetical protein